jgi:hypothetical protein
MKTFVKKASLWSDQHPGTTSVILMFAIFWLIFVTTLVYCTAVYEPADCYNIQPTVVEYCDPDDSSITYTDGLSFQYVYEDKEYDGETTYDYKENGIPEQIELYVNTRNPERYSTTAKKSFLFMFVILFAGSIVSVVYTSKKEDKNGPIKEEDIDTSFIN